MKTTLSLCLAVLIIFAYGVPAHCQGDSLVEGMKTVDGNVVSVDLPNSQIVVKSSETMTFSVPSSADIIDSDGFSIQLTDVTAGNYVTVSYTNDKSGRHIMSGMQVEYKS